MLHAAMSDEVRVYQSFPADGKTDIAGTAVHESQAKRKKSGRKRIYHLTTKGKKTMKESCVDFCRTFHGIFENFVCEKCK